MRKQSPFMMLLLALLLTANHVAISAHEIGHQITVDDSQQCPLCVSGFQPSDKPVSDAIPLLPKSNSFHNGPAGNEFLQCKAVYQNQNPRASPSIA